MGRLQPHPFPMANWNGEEQTGDLLAGMCFPAAIFFFAPFSGLRRPRSKSARLLSAKSVFDRAAHSQELAFLPYVLSGLACLVDGQKRWVCRPVDRIAARAERHGCSPSRGSPAWLLRRFRSFSHPSGANERTAAQAHRWCLRALCAVGLPVRATSRPLLAPDRYNSCRKSFSNK